MEKENTCNSVIYEHIPPTASLHVFVLLCREQLLKVLLCITSGVLSQHKPEEKDNTLGGRLAQAIFQVRLSYWGPDLYHCSVLLAWFP